VPNNIVENKELKHITTFGVPASARYFTIVKSEEDFIDAISFLKNNKLSYLILGGGSNLLFTQNFSGIVIKNELKGIEIVSETDDEVVVKVGSGEVWHELVLWSVGNGYGGLENLSLIPGSCGAAPIQNIGAYGVELKDVFVSCSFVTVNSGVRSNYSKNECSFGYRDSVFKRKLKGEVFITDITLRLSKNPVVNTSYGAISGHLSKMNIDSASATPKDVSEAVIKIRQSKLPDPALLGNAGSFFKNPVVTNNKFDELKTLWPEIVGYPVNDRHTKLAAGWLIENCDWKGKRIGEVGSHKDQALVLVNFGNATGFEVYELAIMIQKSVNEKFGVKIEPEVNII